MMNGSENSFTIGLMNALMTPKTSATNSTVSSLLAHELSPLARLTPGTTSAASQSARPFTTTLMRMFFTGAFWHGGRCRPPLRTVASVARPVRVP